MSTDPKPTSAERTRDYRRRLRGRGLKPRTVWTFDVKDPAFLARVREGSLRLSRRASEREADSFIAGHLDESGDWT